MPVQPSFWGFVYEYVLNQTKGQCCIHSPAVRCLPQTICKLFRNAHRKHFEAHANQFPAHCRVFQTWRRYQLWTHISSQELLSKCNAGERKEESWNLYRGNLRIEENPLWNQNPTTVAAVLVAAWASAFERLATFRALFTNLVLLTHIVSSTCRHSVTLAIPNARLLILPDREESNKHIPGSVDFLEAEHNDS